MKNKLVQSYFCSNCGFTSLKWLGKCPDCNSWNTFEQEIREKKEKTLPASKGELPVTLEEVNLEQDLRFFSGISEIDRVLGNGLVKGSVTLIGGEPGIGKSTLMLQYCHAIQEKGLKTLYLSGEESLKQLKLRAIRLGLKDSKVSFLNTTCYEKLEPVFSEYKPDLIVIDSIQTLFSMENDSLPGSINQIKEVSFRLLKTAKEKGISIIIIGHITKEGYLAGPKVLEHLVDTVVYFESDQTQSFRILRCTKNRFGSTNEMGIFEMNSAGLKEIENPSSFFLSRREDKLSGTAVTSCIEGTRPLMVEIQALVSQSSYAMPKRHSIGIDGNRVALLISILEKRGRLKLYNRDVIVKVVGGIKIEEPSVDLAVAVAIISSYFDKEFRMNTLFNGEIDLTGKIRTISHLEKRIQEAEKLGFVKFVLPLSENLPLTSPRLKIVQLDSIQSLIQKLFSKNEQPS